MIDFHVTGDVELVAKLGKLGERVTDAIRDEMRRQWLVLQGKVVAAKLSGDPLHRITGTLASSINVGGPSSASDFSQDASEIRATVGTNVRYAFVHEYGGTFGVPAHTRLGKPVAAYAMHVPERSFLRSTLREQADTIQRALAQSVQRATEAGP